MKNLTLIIIYSFFVLTAFSQENETKNKVDFDLGNGLTFNFNDKYHFKLSGMMQSSVSFEKWSDQKTDVFFRIRRAYFNLSGDAVQEKVSFFLQTDFTQSNPLLDAWAAYAPLKQLKLTFGQKQNIANNRELLFMEDKLQFIDRGLLSNSFSGLGREFGLFAESNFAIKKFEIRPQLAVTTGDGRLFSSSGSTGFDLGGLKYSARIDLLPLGDFSEGNNNLVADLLHEDKPNLALGAAFSYNDGASDQVGEGQGNILLYDENKELKLPDYRQLYFDILMKYKGFSLLGEYVVATATQLDGSFTDPASTTLLIPTQISEYLALGSAYHVQLGYATKSGYAVDIKYERLNPEFGENGASIIQKADSFGGSFTKYFKGNGLKLQASVQYTKFDFIDNKLFGGLTCQIVL